MAAQKILVPYNFTVYERKALDFLINTFANREDVRITLFNTYTPLPEIDIEARATISQSEELREKEAGLLSAKEHLLENGFSDDQIDYIFKMREKSLIEEIIGTVLKGHYRVLVLSRQAGKVTRFFSRSVHSRVLSVLKDVTICIAT